jgi:hypothetical protein
MLNNYKRFLDSLVPAQMRAIGHLIFQSEHINICDRRLLARTKGVVTLQYVLLNWCYDLRVPPSWFDCDFGERRLKEVDLESLVRLPQLRSVNIEPRMILNPELSDTQVMQGNLALSAAREWAEIAERKMLERGSSKPRWATIRGCPSVLCGPLGGEDISSWDYGEREAYGND